MIFICIYLKYTQISYKVEKPEFCSHMELLRLQQMACLFSFFIENRFDPYKDNNINFLDSKYLTKYIYKLKQTGDLEHCPGIPSTIFDCQFFKSDTPVI